MKFIILGLNFVISTWFCKDILSITVFWRTFTPEWKKEPS